MQITLYPLNPSPLGSKNSKGTPDIAGGSAPQSAHRHCMSTRLMSWAEKRNAGWEQEKKTLPLLFCSLRLQLFYVNSQDCSVNTASSDDSKTCRCLMAPQLWGSWIFPFLLNSFLHLTIKILNSGIRCLQMTWSYSANRPLSTQSRAFQVHKSLNSLKKLSGQICKLKPFL